MADIEEQQIGRYRIHRELGHGAMGSVFHGYDPVIDRDVAVKTVRLDSLPPGDAEGYRRRFYEEAQLAGRLSHPGIVTIYDIGEYGAQREPYIVMEFIDGESLQRTADRAPSRLPVATALDIVRQIAAALDCAHAGGVVHRDVKPANVIITPPGRAVLADFGVAQFRRSRQDASREEFGTPAYLAPERIQGQRVDGRADLFSLGVILYWLLTGEKPFTGDDDAVLFKLVYRDPLPPSEQVPALGPQVDAVLARALAKQPELRYQTGQQFADDLELLAEASARLPLPSQPENRPPDRLPIRSWVLHGRWSTLLLAAVVIATVVTIAWVAGSR